MHAMGNTTVGSQSASLSFGQTCLFHICLQNHDDCVQLIRWEQQCLITLIKHINTILKCCDMQCCFTPNHQSSAASSTLLTAAAQETKAGVRRKSLIPRPLAQPSTSSQYIQVDFQLTWRSWTGILALARPRLRCHTGCIAYCLL